MNGYKKIIASAEARRRILSALSFIPDGAMIRLQYRIKTGRWPNLRNPERYTEKLQWYKLHYRNPLMTTCSDKYAVRGYVTSRGFGDMLNELYAVYRSPEEIDFSFLPDAFAMKLNNGSGTNLFINNKSRANEGEVKAQFERWMKSLASSNPGREWGYDGIEPRIVVERLYPRNEFNDIPDYKFFCFDGRVRCLYVMQNYIDDHAKGELGFFDRDFNLLEARRKDFNPLTSLPEKPVEFEKMVECAERLSEGFPHVRVDFFDIEGKAMFAEMTFYNASGYTVFEPDKFDFELGGGFLLPSPDDTHVVGGLRRRHERRSQATCEGSNGGQRG